MNEELIARIQEEGQRSKEIEEQMNIVEQQFNELGKFTEVLDSLENEKSKEILASIGKGVYMKSLIHDDKVFVDAGAGILVKKSIDETKEIIEEQMTKLQEMKRQLSVENENQNLKLRNLMEEIQENKNS